MIACSDRKINITIYKLKYSISMLICIFQFLDSEYPLLHYFFIRIKNIFFQSKFFILKILCGELIFFTVFFHCPKSTPNYLHPKLWIYLSLC
jgi:hypothetical protein